MSLSLRNNALALAGIWLYPSGTAKVLELYGDKLSEGQTCAAFPLFGLSDALPEIEPGETIVAWASCYGETEGGQSGYSVFDANGIFRRLEPTADTEEISQQYEVLRAAKHGDELEEHLQVRWSDSREYALIVDLQLRELWIYESSADLLRRVRYDLKALDPLVWGIENSWAVSWDVYWLRGQAVAVVPRLGYDWTLGSLLIDVATGVAASLDPQSYGRWACLPTGTWHPAGAMFQVAFYWTHTGDAPGDNAETPYWTDGTAVRLRAVWQRVINSSDGEFVASLRTAGYPAYSAASHIAEWSPNGKWFAIGGHQERSRCGFGS